MSIWSQSLTSSVRNPICPVWRPLSKLVSSQWIVGKSQKLCEERKWRLEKHDISQLSCGELKNDAIYDREKRFFGFRIDAMQCTSAQRRERWDGKRLRSTNSQSPTDLRLMQVLRMLVDATCQTWDCHCIVCWCSTTKITALHVEIRKYHGFAMLIQLHADISVHKITVQELA